MILISIPIISASKTLARNSHSLNYLFSMKANTTSLYVKRIRDASIISLISIRRHGLFFAKISMIKVCLTIKNSDSSSILKAAEVQTVTH